MRRGIRNDSAALIQRLQLPTMEPMSFCGTVEGVVAVGLHASRVGLPLYRLDTVAFRAMAAFVRSRVGFWALLALYTLGSESVTS